jgi:single-stranded-DNA-specific exonuclease
MKWQFTASARDTEIKELDHVPPVIKALLLDRGIEAKEDADKFLFPDIKNLYPTSGFKTIDKAAERVHSAIAAGEKILVFGDYDADGVTSTALLIKTLNELGADCDYYIPNRFTEGYGPNEAAFQEAAEKGFQVIITVDTGIAAVHEAEVAKTLGLDLIITDHHEVQEAMPDAFAVIHPKCSPDYPFSDLAGVGVAFKFSQHLLGYFPEHLLDLAAIGTIADMVPLLSENRTLAYFGLRALTATNNPGLKALKNRCKIEGKVTEEDVGFSIGPRINAVGRLQDAVLAVRLLLTEDIQEAEEIADRIHELNEERKKIVAGIVKEAEQLVEKNEKNGVIVVAKQGWNEGVLGIVASRLVKKYDRPAIVLAINAETGQAKGSARSIPAFDLFAGGMAHKELFTHFGGHAQAAGMSLPLENVPHLRKALHELIMGQLSEADFKQVVHVSETLAIPEVTEALVNEIGQLAPFGMANPKPLFHIQAEPSEARQLGNLKNHLKLQFQDEQVKLEGIGFGMGELYSHITPKTAVSVVGELSINEWNGNKKAQIVMQDMQIETWQLFDHRGRRQMDITAYLNNTQRHTVLYDQCPAHLTGEIPGNVGQITYDTALNDIPVTDVLYIFDLPKNPGQLQAIVRAAMPVNIHVCYVVEDSVYFSPFPSREEFKWFYSMVMKRKELNLKTEAKYMMDAKKWTKDYIRFISSVFLELGFVTMEDNIIRLNPNPMKKDLQESSLYQERLKLADIEKVLYYSTYPELKQWFEDCTKRIEAPKEEVSYGL